jgi:hypothetical protein
MWTSYQLYGAGFLLKPGVLVIFALMAISLSYPIWQDRMLRRSDAKDAEA